MSEEKQYPSSEQLTSEPQPYPGRESEMKPRPASNMSNYRAADKLRSKVAIITGGDSGIGRAVAVAYAMEGADVAYLDSVSGGAEHTRHSESIPCCCGEDVGNRTLWATGRGRTHLRVLGSER